MAIALLIIIAIAAVCIVIILILTCIVIRQRWRRDGHNVRPEKFNKKNRWMWEKMKDNQTY